MMIDEILPIMTAQVVKTSGKSIKYTVKMQIILNCQLSIINYLLPLHAVISTRESFFIVHQNK